MSDAIRLFSSEPRVLALTLLLGVLACLGNAFPISLAFGVDLIFGPIFVFIAIAYFSPVSALGVALAGGLYTWLMWGHPYAAAVFAAEAITVFWLSRRRGKSLLMADILFWVIVGVPATLFYLTTALHLTLDSSGLIALKQFINAIFNVLIASLIVLSVNMARGKFSSFYLGRHQIKNLLFNSMVAITLMAGTLPIIQSGRTDEQNAENLLEARLSGILNHLATDVETSAEPADRVLERFASRPGIDSSLSFAVLDGSGSVVASSGDPWVNTNAPPSPVLNNDNVRFLAPEGDLSFVQTLREGRYEMIQAVPGEQNRSVLIQAPGAPVAESMAQAAFKLLVLLGLLLLIGIVASQLLSRVLTAPIWRLSKALNSSNNGIVITDLAGRVEWLNDGFRKMSGYGLAELKGNRPGDVLQGPRTDQEAVSRIQKALAETGRFEEELINYRKDGSPYIVRIDCQPLHAENGAITGYIAVQTDVTEQRQLSELEKFGREALEQLARRELLGDIFHTVMAHIESMMAVRCVIELAGSESLINSYLSPACYLITGRGSVAALEHNPVRERPIVNSDGHRIGVFRMFRKEKGEPAVFETDLINRATQLIAIATERFCSDRKLQETASVFKHVDEGIFITDANFLVLDVNAAFSTITGLQLREAVGCTVEALLPDQPEALLPPTVRKALAQFGQWQGGTSARNAHGQSLDLGLSISAIAGDQGQVRRYIFLISDITELKEYQRQLESMAKYDALTGLPNRVLLGDRLHQAMRQAERNRGQLAVLFIDLDGFKRVNDTLGHEVGDQLLKVVTGRISAELRGGDTFARFGGDEFVVVLPELEKSQKVEEVVRRILHAVAQPVQLSGQTVDITASIGLTFYAQGDNLEADQLLRQADHAMYAAKQRGRNCYQYFDAENDRAVREFHEGVGQIKSALENQQFVLFYQPKVNLRTGEVIGAEALIRWQHPERGLVSPDQFLPFIEHDALSVNVGEWVLDAALRQMGEWRELGFDLPLSVNINSYHLRQANFAQRLAAILARHPSIPASALELEIVETSALENLENISELICECRRLGVSFSLDDFGTGYSSLSYLRRLPVERLKIDMSFVRDMLQDPNDFAIVNGVLGLADSFGLGVIAEGVETREHSKKLIEIGCDFGQGYGIAKPMPGESMMDWAKRWTREFVAGSAAADSAAIRHEFK